MNKSRLKTILVALFILLSSCLSAQENKSNWYFAGAAGIYSCYPFAGIMYGGLSFYPYVEAGYLLTDNFAVCGAVAAITDFNNKLFLPGSIQENFSCLEYDIGFHWKGLSVYLDDIVDKFRIGNKSSHFLGIYSEWVLSEKYPLSAIWYTLIGSPTDLNSKGNRAYSTFVDLSYPFSLGKHFRLGPDIGVVPWDSPFCGYDSFALCQLGAVGSYTVTLGDRWTIPFTLNAGWNPALKNLYWYSSIVFTFE